MEKKAIILFRRIFGIVLSISIIIAGLCLISACLSIYYSGDKPYSPQSVKEAFSKISIPVFVFLALTIFSFILDFALPVLNEKVKIKKISEMNLLALSEKKSIADAPGEILTSINRQRNLRLIHTLIRTLLICIGAAVFLIYALNPANFHSSEINSSMISAMWVLTPCVIVPFGYSVFTAFFFDRSYSRETELLKKLPNSESIDKKSDKKTFVDITRIVILAVAAALLIYGLIMGGTADVLTKAVNICTECIGLG